MRQKPQFMPMGGAQFYPPYANYITMQNNYFFNPYYSPYQYTPVEGNK